MIKPWIMTLLSLSVFCVMLSLAVKSYFEVQVSQEHIKTLEIRKSQLAHWVEEHDRVSQEVEQWNELWESVLKAGIVPSKWQRYPVEIHDVFLPHEAQNILRLLSNDIKSGQYFWFAPVMVQVKPVMLPSLDSDQERPALKMTVQAEIMTTGD